MVRDVFLCALWMVASVAACVHVDMHDDPPPPKPRPSVSSPPDPAEERARLIKADYGARHAPAPSQQPAQVATTSPAPESTAPPSAPAADSCASGATDREALYADYVSRRRTYQALVDWEAEHCRFVDGSHPVVRVGQDSNGEYHAWEGYSEAVHRECNAKPPKGLDGVWSKNLAVPFLTPADRATLDRCVETDAATSRAACAYRTMGDESRARTYARHREFGPPPTRDGGVCEQ